MWYVGGKHRQGKIIAKFVEAMIKSDMPYIEPFCGSMSSAVHVLKICNPSYIVLSDIDQALMRFWDATINKGKIPPNTLTDAIFKQYKKIRILMIGLQHGMAMDVHLVGRGFVV